MCDPGFAKTAERTAATGWPSGDGADPSLDVRRQKRCAPRSGAANGREALVERSRAPARARLISNGLVLWSGWRWTPGRWRTSSRRVRSPRTFRGDHRERRRRRRSEGMRQISADGDRRLDRGPSPGLVLDQPSPKRVAGARRSGRNAAALANRAEARSSTQPSAAGSLARSPPSSATTRGRELAGGGAGAASSTICVRHQRPPSSRSGSSATRPAASRSSSHRCTLRRWARTNRARSARPRGTLPHPITGASPTTSCAIDVAYRADRAAWPSRNR